VPPRVQKIDFRFFSGYNITWYWYCTFCIIELHAQPLYLFSFVVFGRPHSICGGKCEVAKVRKRKREEGTAPASTVAFYSIYIFIYTGAVIRAVQHLGLNHGRTRTDFYFSQAGGWSFLLLLLLLPAAYIYYIYMCVCVCVCVSTVRSVQRTVVHFPLWCREGGGGAFRGKITRPVL
jgi:hypothetical protein